MAQFDNNQFPAGEPERANRNAPQEAFFAPLPPLSAPNAGVPGQGRQAPEQRGRAARGNANAKSSRKRRKSIGLAVVITVFGILLLGGWISIFGYFNCWFGHVWQAADCTTGKICTRCSAVDEEPLGHLWQQATCTSPKTCTRCQTTSGASLGHSWKSATCTSPKTCTRCQTISGASLGHSWKSATCTSPKTCTRCQTTSGASLGHQWRAATYYAPKTCTVCGTTTGTALKRTPSVAAGDIVTFGKYEQDNNTRNGTESIQWVVLDVQGDCALLLSRYALDSVRYHSSYVNVDWADCTLRSWLNDTFLYAAFSAQERGRIVSTNTESGAWDSVFLLSTGEVYYYLSSSWERTCPLTSYAISAGATEKNNVAQWWWTRSPGTSGGQATFFNFEGDSYSAYVNNYSLAVRPAVWIRLD